MKRKATNNADGVDYPSFSDYHANRREFLKKLGIGAAVLASGCHSRLSSMPGHEVPPSGSLPVSQGSGTSEPPEVLLGEPSAQPLEEPAEKPVGERVAPELPEPPEMVDGDLAMPAPAQVKGGARSPKEPVATAGIPPAPEPPPVAPVGSKDPQEALRGKVVDPKAPVKPPAPAPEPVVPSTTTPRLRGGMVGPVLGPQPEK